MAPLDTSQASETELTPSETFRSQSFLPVIDQFVSSLRQGLEACKLVDARFGFLSKLDSTTVNEAVSYTHLDVYKRQGTL